MFLYSHVCFLSHHYKGKGGRETFSGSQRAEEASPNVQHVWVIAHSCLAPKRGIPPAQCPTSDARCSNPPLFSRGAGILPRRRPLSTTTTCRHTKKNVFPLDPFSRPGGSNGPMCLSISCCGRQSGPFQGGGGLFVTLFLLTLSAQNNRGFFLIRATSSGFP